MLSLMELVCRERPTTWVLPPRFSIEFQHELMVPSIAWQYRFFEPELGRLNRVRPQGARSSRCGGVVGPMVVVAGPTGSKGGFI